MEAINLTQSQLAERFRIEVQKFNDKHLANMVNEVLHPELYGTERVDLMASTMNPFTEIEQQVITATLDWEITKEAANRWMDSL